MVSSRDMTVSKVSVRGRVKSRPDCLTYCSGCSPIFWIIESSIPRKNFDVYFMCAPRKGSLLFRASPHIFLLCQPFLRLLLICFYWISNLMTLISSTLFGEVDNNSARRIYCCTWALLSLCCSLLQSAVTSDRLG